MYDFLIKLFGISAVLGVISLIMYICKGVLRKRFSASCRYFLWLLVILRLCIPVTVLGMPSLIELSVPQILQSDEVLTEEIPKDTEPVIDSSKEPVQNIPVTPVVSEKNPVENVGSEPVVPPLIENVGGEDGFVEQPVQGGVENEGMNAFAPESSVATGNGNTPFQPTVPENNHSENEVNVNDSQISVPTIIIGVWLTGALVFFAVDLIKYIVFLKGLKNNVFAPNSNIIGVYERVCKEKGVRRAPNVFVSEAITSPMLLGVLSPMIVLPALELDEEAWAGIIGHELTHFKRHDLWVKFAAVAARSLHWFNPTVYMAVSMMNEEMELSCDEKTLKNVSEENRLKYGTVMVDILRNCKGRVNAFSTHFNPNKNTAKGRIMNILDSTKKRKGIALVSLCLVICIVSGSVFGCVSNSDGNDDNKETIVDDVPDTKEDGTPNEPTKEKIDYYYEYARIENIENGDSALFEPFANAENLSKTDKMIYKFTTLAGFGTYIGNYTEISKLDSKDLISDLTYYSPKSHSSKYRSDFFADNCLIVVQTKETADKRYVVSDLNKDGNRLVIELYPVEHESNTDGYTCQFYLIEVAKSDIRDVTEFSAEVFEPTDSYDDKLYYSKEAEKVAWDYPTDKTKVEKNEKGEYKRIDFYTNDPTWQLYYEIDGPYMTLTNGKVAYTFDDDRKKTNPTYDSMFFPEGGEKSAAAIISPDGRYAVVLYDRLTLVYGEYKSTIIRIIDLITGQTVEANSAIYDYIFTSNRLSTKYLNSYLPIKGYTKELFHIDTYVEFIDRDTLLIHRQLLTDDGNIRLYDRLEYNVGQIVEKDFDSFGEYTGILKDDVKEKASIDYKYVEYTPKEPADNIIDWSDSTDLSGYSIKLKVPSSWDDQGGGYCLHNSSEGVDLWHVFSVEKNYIFKDDFLNYASPDRRYTEDSPHSLVTFPHNLKEWKITRGTTVQGYDYISYGSKYYLRVTNELVWTVEFMSGVPLEAYELKNEIINSIILVKKVGTKKATSLEEIDSLDVYEGLKEMAKALLTNDTATMERLAYCKSGTYDEYKNIKFGSFTATVTATSYEHIEITVEVENVSKIMSFASNADNKVHFIISLGVNGILLSDSTVGTTVFPDSNYYSKETAFLYSWFSTPSFDYNVKRAADIPPRELSSYSLWLYDCLYNFAKHNCKKADGGSYTDGEYADMIKEYAEKEFGLTDHKGYSTIFSVNDEGEKYYSFGHGGANLAFRIYRVKFLDENGLEVTYDSDYSICKIYVWNYADPGRTVKSQLIEYTISMGELFPDFITYEIIDDTGYKPFGEQEF